MELDHVLGIPIVLLTYIHAYIYIDRQTDRETERERERETAMI